MARFGSACFGSALVALALLSGTARAADPGAALPPGVAPAPGPTTPAPGPALAVLQGLDKTTARVTKFDAPVGQTVNFGTLRIMVRDCRKRPPEEEPESAAYLDIDEVLQDKAAPKRIFSGWMFASSPALNSLENPVYDVWLLDCRTTDTASSAARPG